MPATRRQLAEPSAEKTPAGLGKKQPPLPLGLGKKRGAAVGTNGEPDPENVRVTADPEAQKTKGLR